METETRADKLELVGGRLCLDFTNTVSRHSGPEPNERLTSYAELVAWGRHVGIVELAKSERLLAEAEARPGEAAAVLRRAIALREAFYRVFSARAVALPPAESDLALLNDAISDAMPRLRLAYDGFHYDWVWDASAELDQPLWPVVRSAAELLTAGELERVRECAGDSCNWLFLDTSKNRSRRWCDMNDCGNRAKARRHYQRARATGA